MNKNKLLFLIIFLTIGIILPGQAFACGRYDFICMIREAIQNAKNKADQSAQDSINQLKEIERLRDLEKIKDFMSKFNINPNDSKDQILDKLLPKINGLNAVKFVEDLKEMKSSLSRNVTADKPMGDFSSSPMGIQVDKAMRATMVGYVASNGDNVDPLYSQVMRNYNSKFLVAMIPTDEQSTLFPLYVDNSSEQSAVDTDTQANIESMNSTINSFNTLTDNIFSLGTGSTAINSMSSSSMKILYGNSTAFQLRLGFKIKNPAVPITDLTATTFVIVPVSWGSGNHFNANRNNMISQAELGIINFTAGIELGVGLSTKPVDFISTGLASELNVNFQCKLTNPMPKDPNCMVHSFTWNVINADFSIGNNTVVTMGLITILDNIGGVLAQIAATAGLNTVSTALHSIINVMDDLRAIIDASNKGQGGQSIRDTLKQEAFPSAFTAAMITGLALGAFETNDGVFKTNVRVLTEVTPLQLTWLNRHLGSSQFKAGWQSTSDSSIDLVGVRLLEQVQLNVDLSPAAGTNMGLFDFYLRFRNASSQFMAFIFPVSATGRDYLDLLGEYGNNPFAVAH